MIEIETLTVFSFSFFLCIICIFGNYSSLLDKGVLCFLVEWGFSIFGKDGIMNIYGKLATVFFFSVGLVRSDGIYNSWQEHKGVSKKLWAERERCLECKTLIPL